MEKGVGLNWQMFLPAPFQICYGNIIYIVLECFDLFFCFCLLVYSYSSHV